MNEIFLKHNTDKGPGFHNYSRQYERVFSDFRNRPIFYLEIGVKDGESLRAMREVFPQAEKIVGIDIMQKSKKHEDLSQNIQVEIGDASDASFLKKVVDKYGPFDIILDDGSHTNAHVIQSFEVLFPLLSDRGLYVVEDTICFKSKQHLVSKYPNHLNYFTQQVPFLNQWRFDSTQGIKDHCIDPFKIQKKTTNIFEASIDRIEFGCSQIAISKLVRNHWL